MFLSESDFAKVVNNTPLVSIDLCIMKGQELLIGKRINPPARNFFFVPGGRIIKSELRKNALKRILRNELGFVVKPNHDKFIQNLGIYEHFYEDNFLGNKNFNTHYVVIAEWIPFESLNNIKDKIKSEQHSEYIWFDINKFKNSSYRIHQNTIEYMKNLLLINL